MSLLHNIRPQEQRIAKNTVLLFVRMGVLMLINILAVRYLRSGLGVVEYGILTAVTGLVNMVSCLNTVLSTASQRYMSVALGEGQIDRMRQTFRSSMRITGMMVLGIVVLMETVGLWFVMQKINYPAGRETAVMIAYQMTVVTFVLNIMHVPYLGEIIAHEQMNIFAIITILDAAIKLALAVVLRYIVCDKLVVYSVCLALGAMLTLSLYAGHAYYHFDECRGKVHPDKSLIREMLGFSGWSFFGALAGVCMLQGTLLMLNIESGPVANAAFAVSLTMYTAFSQLGNNITMAVRPQLIMACSGGDERRTRRLFYLSTLALTIMLLCVAVPFHVWMPDIVRIWLGDADMLTIRMCQGMVWVAVILCVSTPITILMQALGRVRQYHLPVESMTLMCIPVGLWILRHGYSPEMVCAGIIACCLLAHLVRIACLVRYCPYCFVWKKK